LPYLGNYGSLATKKYPNPLDDLAWIAGTLFHALFKEEGASEPVKELAARILSDYNAA
jgi:hypothetical protein